MSCDYYIQRDIVIDYHSTDGTIKQFRINIKKERGYVGFISDENEKGDIIDTEEEYERQLKLRLDNNTYKIILYENDYEYEKNDCKKNDYKKKYKDMINEILSNERCIKIYEDVYAYKK